MDVTMFILLIAISICCLFAYKKISPDRFKGYVAWVVLINAVGVAFFLYRCSIL